MGLPYNSHTSVLLEQSIELLDIKPDGLYVDGTLGRGGHTQAILNLLNDKGRLIAFDKDIEAISYVKSTIQDERLILIHDSFANLEVHLERLNLSGIDGLLLDLGVSSPQLDSKERGFSFRFDAPLDMRMDNTRGITLKDWLETASEAEIKQVLWRYGEEKFAGLIAKNIVKTRVSQPITMTRQLVQIIESSMPYKAHNKNPATRSFQAFRIYINNELNDLEKILGGIKDWLLSKGRVVIISFHSLEDRIVKEAFKALAKPTKLPKWVMTLEDESSDFLIVNRKVQPSDEELLINKRSRSAIMRVLARK